VADSESTPRERLIGDRVAIALYLVALALAGVLLGWALRSA